MTSPPPIPIERLYEHTEMLKADEGVKFSQEYDSIGREQKFTSDHSNLDVNKEKNRYPDVIAYDHSRVSLKLLDDQGSDYINANYMDGYMDGYCVFNAYIATQDPLTKTFSDFWRMVWEQNSRVIVMISKLQDHAMYWPKDGTETYGMIHCTLVDVMELAIYTIRTFEITRDGSAQRREVRQFQFTAWPDHGVPEHPTALLLFTRRVRAYREPDDGPLIVHSSAGVGRTGVFIVTDAMLQRIKYEKTVDIYGFVTRMCAQRNFMVQTKDQYIFVHDALLEAVSSGDTQIPAKKLYLHIQLQPGENITRMESEFKRLESIKADSSRFVSANLPINRTKNRLDSTLPYESPRVTLQPISGVDGSDYINANFIDGYRVRKAYIATQSPLPETTKDFWRMLWEHNSTIVVMLTKPGEIGQDGKSRTIRQFQFTDWSAQGMPKSGEDFNEFIGQVHRTKEQFGQDGPISVHCSAGVGHTGVFITLSIELERMQNEGVVDMFTTVKILRTQRPGMVQTEDQYQFCYRAALDHLMYN